MSQLMDFLLEQGAQAPVTTMVDLPGFPQPFVIQSITEGENKALRKACQRTYLDPKTHQKITETDVDLLNNRLIVACCVDPNLKDATLQERFGVKGGEALLDKLLKPFEYLELLMAVQGVNGCVDMDEVRKDAKN